MWSLEEWWVSLEYLQRGNICFLRRTSNIFLFILILTIWGNNSNLHLPLLWLGMISRTKCITLCDNNKCSCTAVHIIMNCSLTQRRCHIAKHISSWIMLLQRHSCIIVQTCFYLAIKQRFFLGSAFPVFASVKTQSCGCYYNTYWIPPDARGYQWLYTRTHLHTQTYLRMQ